MYAYPTIFPETSNREDLFRVISIFDDDTGQPVNLTGIILLLNPNGFTGSNWKITDGLITTTSSTSFTVPGFPVINQLSALSLTVVDAGQNLAFKVGDPVTVTDVAGNATIIGYVTSYTLIGSGQGTLVAQIGMTFQFEIRSQFPYWNNNNDYSPWYDWGGGIPGGPAPIIMAGLGTGLSIIDVGFIQINIPESTMRQLHHKTYLACLTLTDSVSTRQVITGKLPMLYGGVTN